MDLLNIILKPSVTEISKYVGSIALNEFGIRNVKTFNKLSLKKNNKRIIYLINYNHPGDNTNITPYRI